MTATQRADQAYNVSEQAAAEQRQQPLPSHPTNGDEELYANKIANYSKALPHSSLGEVNLPSYNALIQDIPTQGGFVTFGASQILAHEV